MNRNISVLLLFLVSLFMSCASKIETEVECLKGNRTVRFQLSTPENDFVLTRASAGGRVWKAFSFDENYRLLSVEEGTLDAGATTVEMELEKDKTYRLLFTVAAGETKLPSPAIGTSYWNLGLYKPGLPLQDPKAVMVSRGNDKGLLRLDIDNSTVKVGLIPLATRVKVESQLNGLSIKSVTLENACSATFWSLADNTTYTADGLQIGNGMIAPIEKTSYSPVLESGTCYVLPDLCIAKNGLQATVGVSLNGRDENVLVSVPKNMALKMGAGKTYYIRISENADHSLNAVWALRSVNAGRESHITFDEDEYQAYDYTLTDGIDGSAIDLSENSYNRKSIFVDAVDPADLSKSFTTGVWVKTNARSLGTKAILTNQESMNEAGFVVSTQDNGSWQVLFSNGSHEQLEYKPTVQRQPVNDGEWHFLTISFNKAKGELRMYYDGLNVAIYGMDGIKDLNSGHGIKLGSIDSSSWNCFNGALDEFFFTDKVMTSAEIGELYTSLSKKKVNQPELQKNIKDFKIMDFNIWHGGHEFGEEVGVQRVVDVIKSADPDIVGIIETYGSGEEIADALGYCLYLNCSGSVNNTNLAIVSRYPIEETFDLYDSFKCSAARIRLSETQEINLINLWLNWTPLTDQQVRIDKIPVDQIVKDEWTTRATELKDILAVSKNMGNNDLPMIVCGDFNSGSHLDWTEAAKDMFYGYVFPWPTSVMMEENGYIDSYRELYTDPVQYPCFTWSPFSKSDLQYRIDFIYYKAKGIKAVESEMLDQHPVRFPSDHAAMMTKFKFN